MIDQAITPPPELVQQWYDQAKQDPCGPINWVAVKAAQWGADQELEACCVWTAANFGELPGQNLHLYRRPKQPSLKEQALKAFEQVEVIWATDEFGKETNDTLDTIRRALEALDD